jgi:hypothetical protein
VGVSIDEKDYCSTIISSLPGYLAGFASSQLAAARLYSLTKTINPDILISLIAKESDRQRVARSRRGTTSTSKSKDVDEAMAVSTPSHKRKFGGNSRGNSADSKKPRTCWNCGDEGHFRRNCPKPPKEKKPAASGSANVAEDSDDEDGVFGVTDSDSLPHLQSCSDSDSDDDSMPDLQTVSSSSDGSGACDVDDSDDDGREDWFSEVGDDLDSPWGDGWSTEELSGVESDRSSLVDVDLDSVSQELNDVAALDSAEPRANEIHTELYDSGSTCHISPYRDMFDNYVEIPLKSFNAANQQKFG